MCFLQGDRFIPAAFVLSPHCILKQSEVLLLFITGVLVFSHNPDHLVLIVI